MFSISNILNRAIALMLMSACGGFSEAIAQTWSPTDGPRRANIARDLAVGSDGTVQRIWAADEALLKYSEDQGNSWFSTPVPQSLPSVLACKPQDPNWIIIAKPGNNVRVSTDGGEEWLNPPTSDRLVPLRLAVSGTNPNLVFLGTDTVRISSSVWETSLWRSENGGQAWQEIDYFSSSPQGDKARTNIRDIVYHPTSPERIWVAGTSGAPPVSEGDEEPDYSMDDEKEQEALATFTNGVFFSNNGGETWTRYGSSNGLPSTPNVTALLYAEGTPDLLFAAVRTSTTARTRLFQSSNEGENWAETATLPAREVRSMQRHATDAGILVAASDSGFLYSSNRGLTWEKRNSGLTTLDTRRIIFDLNDANTVYLATAHSVFKSTDLGVTWTEVFSASTQSAASLRGR